MIGHWVNARTLEPVYITDDGYLPDYEFVECSECHAPLIGAWEFRVIGVYCPGCGMRMATESEARAGLEKRTNEYKKMKKRGEELMAKWRIKRKSQD